MHTFTVEIVTPDEALPPLTVQALDVQAEEGRLTVLAGHAALTCALLPGLLKATDAGGKRLRWQAGEGVMRVRANKALLLMKAAPTPLEERP